MLLMALQMCQFGTFAIIDLSCARGINGWLAKVESVVQRGTMGKSVTNKGVGPTGKAVY